MGLALVGSGGRAEQGWCSGSAEGEGGATTAYMHNEAHLALRKPRYDAGRTFPGAFVFETNTKTKHETTMTER